jgi:hypothetical protein
MSDGLAGRYSQLVHDKIGWWGTYPVPLPLRVGDYVQMNKDGEIKYLGTVRDWPGWADGLPVESFPYKGKERFWAHATTTGAAGAGAGVATPAASVDASLAVTFSREAGFLVNLGGTSGRRFKSVDTARKWILGAAKSGQWDKESVLITEVIKAKWTTALIAEERGTRFSLQASASLPVDLAAINLTDPALHLNGSVVSGSGSFTSPTQATPLYHCARIRRRWYGKLYAELQAAAAVDLESVFADDPFGDGTDDGDGGSDV